VQAQPVLGTHGPVTINYVTGEITHGKKQTRAIVVYSNIHGDSTCGAAIATGLEPWGDDLVCVPGGGLLSTQSFSVFNGSSSDDLESCDLTARFYDTI
jgi:hypothetical protein